MKKIKKIAAALLTVVMTMVMTVTAFAEGATNTLTVNANGGQNLNGQTVSLYKLFDVTESDSPAEGGTTKNYAYTVNTAYKAALAEVLRSSVTAESTDEQFAKAVLDLGVDNPAEVQNFANDFTAKALTSGLAATATSEKLGNVTSYTFNNLAAGYYLVYVTGGKAIQSSLVTVDATTHEVNLKTEAPNITKTADKETVEIGQVVKYTITGSIPDTTGYGDYQYIIHDTLSTGLDFVNDAKGTALGEGATTVNVTVAFKDAADAADAAPATATLDTANNRKMSLDLSAWVKVNQANKGKEFTVTYYAKVNANAVVTEKNSAHLEYGNKPGETTTTTPSEVKTPTYPLDINKIKKVSEEKLAGAKFSLYRAEKDATDGTNAITVSGSNGNYVVDPTSTNTVFESAASIAEKGYNLHLNGLAEGTYYLKEVEAPAGYNKLTSPIKVTITKDGANVENWTISKNNVNEEDKIIDIENSTGSILPSTGGVGTIAFAVVAGILVIGVVVSFIRDKRKEA